MYIYIYNYVYIYSYVYVCIIMCIYIIIHLHIKLYIYKIIYLYIMYSMYIVIYGGLLSHGGTPRSSSWGTPKLAQPPHWLVACTPPVAANQQTVGDPWVNGDYIMVINGGIQPRILG